MRLGRSLPSPANSSDWPRSFFDRSFYTTSMADPVEMDLDVIEVPIEEPVISREEQGEIQKLAGNDKYRLKDYKGALASYTKAIEWCPNNVNYLGNRSACLLMLSDYNGALADAKLAVDLDPTYIKGFQRAAKCCIALGDIVSAETTISRAVEIEPDSQSFNAEKSSIETLKHHIEDARKSQEKGDYRRVVYCMDRCIAISPACPQFRLWKAESLAYLGRFQEGEELANEVLSKDKSNVEAIYVRGLCLYYQDNVDKAIQHFQTVLRLAPDLQKAKDVYKRCKMLRQLKDEGNDLFRKGMLLDALAKYTCALEVDPLNKSVNSKIYFNRATVCSKLNRLQESIAHCTKALELDPEYQKALLRRAKCYMDLEQYEDAVKDYETVYKTDKSRDVKRSLHEAKLALKKSKRKDYYKILGVDRNAGEEEIKKAYKKKALEHHPDRHAHVSDAEKKEHERLFKEVGEAYGVLLDPKKRARYDNGQDMEDDMMEGGHGFSTMDATNLFNAFYGGDMHDGFAFQSHGFPSNFSFHFG
ncbi:dnaJ homolog subfamily C member 7 [Neocloeon triangulifer]|uniref:dnaJ homolog subfamily C member 7 n=1 Tax=Neocloeon triangulifer TaxID=2078957 RepID=UPI00286F323E|nr:dnaJ homolog subfamily C member 7 [Neocloeon triangulifer]